MGEVYKGTRFKTIFVRKVLPSNGKIKELVHWGRLLCSHGLVSSQGSEGNLSFRTKRGFIITASAARLAHLSSRNFVKVLSFNSREVQVVGVHEPSSETLLHGLVYKNRLEVNAIFHFHDDEVVKNARRLGLPVTKRYYPYGTLELAKEAVSALDDHWFLVLKDHGCLSLGRTIDEAGKRAIEVHEKVLKNRLCDRNNQNIYKQTKLKIKHPFTAG